MTATPLNPLSRLTRYELLHLPIHLAEAGRKYDLRRLLTLETYSAEIAPGDRRENAWYEVREAAGDLADYLADIRLAWRTEELPPFRGKVEWTSETIGWQIRYALMTASMNGMAGRIPNQMRLLLVAKGLWSAEHGLTYAFMQRAVEQIDAVTSLFDRLTDEQKQDVLSAAIETIRLMKDPYERAEGLSGLAPHLPKSILPEALVLTREIEDEGWKTEALRSLAPYLGPALLAEALAAVSEMEDEGHRALALAGLAPYLQGKTKREVVAEALDLARQLEPDEAEEILTILAPHLSGEMLSQMLPAVWETEEEDYRAETLTDLLAHLRSRTRREVAAEILALARQIEPDRRADLLTNLASHLPATMLPEALACARDIEDEQYRAEALAGLLPHLRGKAREEVMAEALALARRVEPHASQGILTSLASHLPTGRLSDALAAARQIDEPHARAAALSGLAPHLVRRDKARATAEALAAARSVDTPYARATALIGVAQQLEEPARSAAVSEAMAAIDEVDDASTEVDLLASLAPQLSDAQLRVALDMAWGSSFYDFDRAALVGALAPYLSESLLQEALTLVATIGDPSRESALEWLASHLSERLLHQALTTARLIGDQEAQLRTLAELLTYLDADDRAPCLQRALGTMRATARGSQRAAALANFGSHLSGTLLHQALTIAGEINEEEYRAPAITTLLPYLPRRLRAKAAREALEAAWKIDTPAFKARALVDLSPYLPRAQLANVLAYLLEGGNPDETRERLGQLAPHLTERLLVKALVLAKATEDEEQKAAIFTALLPQLPKALQTGAAREAYDAARAVEYPLFRARALLALAPLLSKRQKAKAVSDALAAVAVIQLDDWRDNTRRAFLKQLAPELPTSLLSQALALIWAERTTDEFSDLVGAYMPRFTRSLRKEALALANRLESKESRVEVLTTFLPHLPSTLRCNVSVDALRVAQSIAEPFDRAKALSDLAPYLPRRLLADVLDMANELEGEYRAILLAGLAPHLPAALLERALSLAHGLDRRDGRARARAFTALASCIATPAKEEVILNALAEARASKYYYEPEQALLHLSPHLSDDFLSSALQTARKIRQPETRVRVLEGLLSPLSYSARLEVLKEALLAAQEIDSDVDRTAALRLLANHLGRLRPRQLFALWSGALASFAAQPRESLLEALRAVLPVIRRLGGESGVQEAALAIDDVGRWWP
jgi:hypothetical protein